jgi:hypothetical protein
MNTRHPEPQPSRLRWTAWLAGSLLVLGGCATTQVDDPGSWPAVPIQKAQFMPSDEVLSDPNAINRRTRVIVMQARDSASFRGQGLAEHASSGLEALLGSQGGVEVIDRKLGDKLDSELKLIEVRGTSAQGYSGPAVADYAVTVELGPSNFSSPFAEAVLLPQKDKPPIVLSPRGFVHTGKAAMTVRLYELPSMRLVLQEGLEGSITKNGQPIPLQGSQGLAFVRDAITDAIGDVKGKLLTELSPRGYIVDRRSKDKKSIFRALISRQTGAKQGDVVEIFSLRQNVIEIGSVRRTTSEEVRVATGRVTNNINNDFSWIIIDDEKQAAQVRQGDVVRVRHRNDILNLNNPVKSLTNLFKP